MRFLPAAAKAASTAALHRPTCVPLPAFVVVVLAIPLRSTDRPLNAPAARLSSTSSPPPSPPPQSPPPTPPSDARHPTTTTTLSSPFALPPSFFSSATAPLLPHLLTHPWRPSTSPPRAARPTTGTGTLSAAAARRAARHIPHFPSPALAAHVRDSLLPRLLAALTAAGADDATTSSSRDADLSLLATPALAARLRAATAGSASAPRVVLSGATAASAAPQLSHVLVTYGPTPLDPSTHAAQPWGGGVIVHAPLSGAVFESVEQQSRVLADAVSAGCVVRAGFVVEDVEVACEVVEAGTGRVVGRDRRRGVAIEVESPVIRARGDGGDGFPTWTEEVGMWRVSDFDGCMGR